MTTSTEANCERCSGSGTLLDPIRHDCPACNGTGRRKVEEGFQEAVVLVRGRFDPDLEVVKRCKEVVARVAAETWPESGAGKDEPTWGKRFADHVLYVERLESVACAEALEHGRTLAHANMHITDLVSVLGETNMNMGRERERAEMLLEANATLSRLAGEAQEEARSYRADRDIECERGDRLAKLLEECIEEYEYAADYKGDYLKAKHGDAETVARFRAALAQEYACPNCRDTESRVYCRECGGTGKAAQEKKP